MRAVIIGAGVAGTVAAMALHKAGWEASVYEACETSTGLGQGTYLTVAVNGLDALRAIDAEHVVTASGFPTRTIGFFTRSGRKLAELALGPTLDGRIARTIRRSAFYRGLHDEALARGILIEHRKRLVGADMSPTGSVVARFADGCSVEGDLLIGADGGHSRTRSLIDRAIPGPRYTGFGTTGGFTRAIQLDARPGDYRVIAGKHCLFGYVLSPDGEVWWYAYPPRPEALTDDQISMMGAAQMRHWLVGLLEADRSPGARIVCSTTGEIPYNNQYDLPTAPRWHRGRIVILGDAAHAVSPSSVQGCSLACEDAVVLALCLRRSSSVERALAHYERIRRSRVERVHKWGSQMSITTKRGLAARAVSPLVLPAITGHIGQRHHMGKLSWMFGHHITWNQPTSVLT